MIVVLDTNVFVYNTHLLRNEIGQQFLKFLRAKRGQLFIPEILRVEYLKQTRKAANDKQGNVAANASELLSLVGQSIGYDVLSGETIDQATEDRLSFLQNITLPGPSLADLHSASGDRFVAERPPAPNAGYKDCMIWEAILTLQPGSDVCLVTRDNGFYDDRGLLSALVNEAQGRNIRVQGFRKLDLLLQQLQADTPELDLADQDIAEEAQNPPEAEQPEMVLPSPAEPALPKEDSDQVTGQELERALGRVQETFQDADARVLGFIAFLEMAGKDQIFGLLNQAGMTTDIANNSAERLALGGAVRDTGTHYLVEDRALALAAASRVEEEIINLLNKGERDGH